MRQIILISFLSIMVLACTETSDEGQMLSASKNYTGIEIVDSVLIEHLGEAELWDVSQDGNKYS